MRKATGNSDRDCPRRNAKGDRDCPRRKVKKQDKKGTVPNLELIKRQRLDQLIAQGVKILDPTTTYIDKDVKIGKVTVIYPSTVIEFNVRIGKNCCIGPFARLRQGTRLEDRAQIGNFVEVVRSRIKGGSKAKHLTYIGDATVEENVNIGAGAIVANYNGKFKSKTRICQNAFIGSGSILIAPVKVGKSAVTGAGAVVTKNRNVPDNAVVVGVPAKVIENGRYKGGRDCPRRTKRLSPPCRLRGRLKETVS